VNRRTANRKPTGQHLRRRGRCRPLAPPSLAAAASLAWTPQQGGCLAFTGSSLFGAFGSSFPMQYVRGTVLRSPGLQSCSLLLARSGPWQTGPASALMLISGSGTQNRNGTSNSSCKLAAGTRLGGRLVGRAAAAAEWQAGRQQAGGTHVLPGHTIASMEPSELALFRLHVNSAGVVVGAHLYTRSKASGQASSCKMRLVAGKVGRAAGTRPGTRGQNGDHAGSSSLLALFSLLCFDTAPTQGTCLFGCSTAQAGSACGSSNTDRLSSRQSRMSCGVLAHVALEDPCWAACCRRV